MASRASFHASGGLRNLVDPHVGPDKAFKSMHEFEALRPIRAEDMRPDQVLAFKAIRAAVPPIAVGSPIRKVISPADADLFIAGTRPAEVGGYIVHADDMADLVGASRAQIREGLRLDRVGGPLEGSGGYAVIEMDATAEIALNARVPKCEGFWAGGNDRVYNIPFPNTGHGLIGCPDRLRAEFSLSSQDILSGYPNSERYPIPLGGVMRKYSDTGSPTGIWDLVLNPSGIKVWVPR